MLKEDFTVKYVFPSPNWTLIKHLHPYKGILLHRPSNKDTLMHSATYGNPNLF
ncbi:hypothetical protein F511_40429 [Dorcoceras hygrometricum]|uniref:Uncharacterized protein n=1 Tax=Dorcoceras hygrometricum TaxID=472368 RepID=A0A2Z7ASU1_9LAMI|nr:hypothetical protein F511_40429 [Dorcoceras hygrometricum]